MLIRDAAEELFRHRDARTIPWLDFCRALAVLLVLGGHCIDFGLSGIGVQVFNWGWTGVDLFFVLSGFLIAKQLWGELAATGDVRVRQFLLKRGLRIWPLYYSTIVIVFALDFPMHRSPKPLLADLFCVSDYFHHQVPGGWSLSIEEQFYLILPILLLLLRRLPPKALLAIPVGWLLLLPLIRHYTMAEAAALGVEPLIGNVPIVHTFHAHTDGLAVGVLLAWLSVFCRPWWRSGRGRYFIPLVAISLGMMEHKLRTPTFSFTALAVLYGGLVIAGLRAQLPNRLTSWRIFHLLSRLSYGSYLNNLILLQLIDPYTHRYASAHGSNAAFFAAWFVGFVLLSNAVAFVTYALIELPFLRVRERWLKRQKDVGAGLRSAQSPLAVEIEA